MVANKGPNPIMAKCLMSGRTANSCRYGNDANQHNTHSSPNEVQKEKGKKCAARHKNFYFIVKHDANRKATQSTVDAKPKKHVQTKKRRTNQSRQRMCSKPAGGAEQINEEKHRPRAADERVPSRNRFGVLPV